MSMNNMDYYRKRYRYTPFGMGIHDEKRLSPDSMVGPMIPNPKKDKLCLVCGDKALGYNFNAISCESCKAFFRRNAHKTIRGRCEGRCDVNIESRSFCKRCRLAKCFTVGMRKDMILDEGQKRQRKEKILINKLRRHGNIIPDDDVCDNDTKMTCIQRITSQGIDSIKGHLSESELRTLTRMDSPSSTSKSNNKDDYQDKLNQYMPWQDIGESLSEIIEDMDPLEKSVLLEMNKAHESSAFLSSTSTRLASSPSNPTEVFNIADGFVRRIIKVAKQLERFRAIEKDDQICLLKGAVIEIMMLRSAVNFDVRTETWNLSTVSCIKKPEDTSSSTASSPASASSRTDGIPAIPQGLNINQLREAAMKGADINQLRQMAHQKQQQTMGTDNINKIPRSNADCGNDGLESLRNAARAAGYDVDALRKAFMGGSSLSPMAQGRTPMPDSNAMDLSVKVKEEPDSQMPGTSSSISSDVLKLGNTETRTMFVTYSKFIRSLMSIIFGDLVVLKFLIMLSLFSPDRPGLENRKVVDNHQEIYANALNKYISVKYPQEKNMFARCIMKLTDLRNLDEVHTKMLLKMQVENIEPLLVEIFDLPQ